MQFSVFKKYRTRRLIQSVLFVTLCLGAIYKLMTVTLNTLHSPPVVSAIVEEIAAAIGDITKELYILNKEDYYKSIPGLIYDKTGPWAPSDKFPLCTLGVSVRNTAFSP